MTAPTRQLNAPWVTVDDLPATRPALPGGDDEWTELCWRASELLYALSGRQWAGETTLTVILDRPRARSGQGWPPVLWWPTAGWPAVGPWPARRVWEGHVVVALPDPPVVAVDGVTVGGDPFTEWTAWLPTGHLERTDGRPWPLDGSVAVSFRRGIPPPVGGAQSAVALALELGKAAAGDGSCKLPRRITNLQREGVTIGLMDAGEHLDKGRTGLLDVDAWLASVNPHQLARRASAWSPDQPRTRRVTS